MIAASLLCFLASPAFPHTAVTVSTVLDDTAVDAAIEAAGTNVEKLAKLAERYSKASDASAAAKVYRRIIELDPDHEAARAGLRHQFYDGQWFESFVALAKYKRNEAARMKDRGLGLFGDQWVPLEDIPYLTMGWKRNTSGAWIDPVLEAEAKEIAVWQSEGYQFRADDNSWIAPADFEKWTNLLWKCGDEWLGLDGANEYHASLEQCWQLAGEHFVTCTTSTWDTGNLARWHADKTHAYLKRIFGVEPKNKPNYGVLPSLAAYNDAAGGQMSLPDSEGYSSLHGAYFSDACFDASAEPRRYMGMGVSYWDRSSESLDPWGPFWVRWAAAQSYVDAIDPSWLAISLHLETAGVGDPAGYAAAFWSEKRIPRWLRYGAASYVERYLPNPEAAEGTSPWGLRDFAFAELTKIKKLHTLPEIFEFALSQEDLEGSSRLYHEAGLVVAYLLDGAEGETKLHKAHDEFRAALASGSREDVASKVKALEAQLLKKKKEVRAFAGL